MATLAPTPRLDATPASATPIDRTSARSSSAVPSRRADLPWIATGIGAGAATVAVVGWAVWLVSQIQIPI